MLSTVLTLLLMPASALQEHAAGMSSAMPARVRAVANDNRVAAGVRRGDSLHLRLTVERATWHLDADNDPGLPLLAFAEDGQAPMIPGPLIRVPAGTTIRVTVSNPLGDTLVVYGLSQAAGRDPLVVAPQSVGVARFVARQAGTYFYWATTTRAPLRDRFGEDSNLAGAFIVDPAGTAPAPDERVFVLTEHGSIPSEVPGVKAPLWTAINGKSWPHTERLTYALGDSIRWRVINASASPHPMHLHGAYFRVDAKSGTSADTVTSPEGRRMAVTERLLQGETARITWSPGEPGGWLFHCHAVRHVAPHPPIGGVLPAATHHGEIDRHTFHGMSGLVMAIDVPPPPGYREPASVERRRVRLFVNSDSSVSDTVRRFGYVVQEGSAEPAPDSVPLPGSTLVLRRGEPTVIEVINRTPEPTSVHWHGVELESFYDGVVGIGGIRGRTTPAIRPGERFEVALTPRRAGSFMYHTHFSELRQYLGGLTGPLVILEPEDRWEPERDRVFLIGDPRGGGARNTINGMDQPVFAPLRVGTTYRLRLMNIAVGRPAGGRIALLRDGKPVQWRALAKDGWTLPRDQATFRPSVTSVSSGETADFEYTPDRPGELLLEFRAPNGFLFVRAPLTVQ